MSNSSVLFILPSLNAGGAEHQTIQQLNYLHEHGWNVALAVLHPKLDLLESLKIPREQVLILKVKSATLSFNAIRIKRSDLRSLKSFVTAQEVTHIIANLPLGHWYGRLLKLSFGKIRLLNYHRSLQYAANPLNTTGKRFFNFFQSLLAKKTDDVSICISDAVRKDVAGSFHLVNPVILYNAVRDQFDEISASSEQSLTASGRIKMLVPGRIHHSKGQLFFMPSVVELMHKEKQPLEVYFAGGGVDEDALRALIRENNLSQFISITGILPNKELLCKMLTADIIVIPSLHEGLGNVAIEALMLGKTIICSDAGGLPEVTGFGNNAYLFEAGNVSSCLAVCRRVLSQWPASRMLQPKQRQRYLDNFSFESHMAHLMELIR